MVVSRWVEFANTRRELAVSGRRTLNRPCASGIPRCPASGCHFTELAGPAITVAPAIAKLARSARAALASGVPAP
jgi:hypothetical protein